MNINKHDFTDVLIICGSILLTNYIFPIADSITNLIMSKINYRVNKIRINLELDNAEGEAAAEVINPAPSNTQAIGFQIQSQEYYEDE